MIEKLQRSMRAIHDLERAIHCWELLRNNAQRLLNETTARSENPNDSIESNQRVSEFHAFIIGCNTRILEAKARIDRLEREDWKRK
jgi:hypothetical protein